MEKNKKGFSPVILGIIILIVIVVISIVIFAISSSKKSTNKNSSSSSTYTSNLESKEKDKIDIKEVSTIVYEGKEYDLSKTLKESGITVDYVVDIEEDSITQFEELKNNASETDISYYEHETGDSMSVFSEKIASSLTLKPGVTLHCNFKIGKYTFGSGDIINNSSSDKNILDCNIKAWENFKINDDISLNGLGLGKSTSDDVIKQFKKYAVLDDDGSAVTLNCKDGSEVVFTFDGEGILGEEYIGKIKQIFITFNY